MEHLTIHCIQGDPQKMSGRLIVYAIVNDQDIPENLKKMLNNNILAIEGDYFNQKNIRDFFRKEFDMSFEQGIEKIVGKIEKDEDIVLESTKDKVKSKSIRNIEILPIPAKVVKFDSVEEIKLKKGYDVYYLGEFESIQYANLSVNSFPIIYQARYREQENQEFKDEIDLMLETVLDQNDSSSEDVQNTAYEPKDYLLKTLIPNIIYNFNDTDGLKKSERDLEIFLKDYPFPEDIKNLKEYIEKASQSQDKKFDEIELIVDKIWALQIEDYKTLEKIKGRLQDLGL